MKTSPGRLRDRLSRLAGGSAGRWVFMGILVGAAAGVGASGFFYCLEWVSHFAFDTLARTPIPLPAGERLFPEGPADRPPIRLIFFALPIVGGLVSGLLVYAFAPEAEGHGTDAMIDAFHNRRGVVRLRVPLVKSLATLATLGLGGSAGREGPIAQIGAGLGSWIGGRLKVSVRERRILLVAGAAGGLGAIFRSPLGGALTAIEVLYSEDFETEALIPSIISSVTAYAIFTSIFGFAHIFRIPALGWTHPLELLVYVCLGLICVPVGIFYIKVFYGMRDRVFRRIARVPRHFVPAIGGLGVAVLGLAVPQSYGSGWGTVQIALLGGLSVGMMLAILIAKILATSLTIGSGGSGGVFGPTLFIGGMLGGVVGGVADALFPGVISDPRAFVLVGMAAFFAGVANAPIGAMLMICEMTGGYDLLVPLMLVSVIALVFSRTWSIYEKQVKDKFSSPAHLGDLTVNVLEDLKVGDAFLRESEMKALPFSMSFREFRALVAETSIGHYPVADRDGRLVGIVSVDSVRPGLFEEGLDDLMVVSDLASPLVTVTPGEDLYEALIKFVKHSYGELPVVDERDPNRILGCLRHEDVIAVYYREVLRRRKELD